MFELVPGVINVFAVYIVVNVLCDFSEVGFDFLPIFRTLKSNNVEFVQYCGGHFENGDR
jgi:hypothetical protein